MGTRKASQEQAPKMADLLRPAANSAMTSLPPVCTKPTVEGTRDEVWSVRSGARGDGDGEQRSTWAGDIYPDW